MPPLTQSLQVLLPVEKGKYAEELSRNMNRINDLLEELPRFSYFTQGFIPHLKIGYHFIEWIQTNHKVYIHY